MVEFVKSIFYFLTQVLHVLATLNAITGYNVNNDNALIGKVAENKEQDYARLGWNRNSSPTTKHVSCECVSVPVSSRRSYAILYMLHRPAFTRAAARLQSK